MPAQKTPLLTDARNVTASTAPRGDARSDAETSSLLVDVVTNDDAVVIGHVVGGSVGDAVLNAAPRPEELARAIGAHAWKTLLLARDEPPLPAMVLAEDLADVAA